MTATLVLRFSLCAACVLPRVPRAKSFVVYVFRVCCVYFTRT